VPPSPLDPSRFDPGRASPELRAAVRGLEARKLPSLERPLTPAEAPALRRVSVAELFGFPEPPKSARAELRRIPGRRARSSCAASSRRAARPAR
jgi:hypothetical protein